MTDDVQRLLGQLQSDAQSSRDQRKELFAKVADLNNAMHDGFSDLRVMLSPLSKHIEDDERMFGEHHKRLTDLEAGHNKAKGAIWAAGIFGGLAGFLSSKAGAILGLLK